MLPLPPSLALCFSTSHIQICSLTFSFPFGFSHMCVRARLPSWQDCGVIKQAAFQITAPTSASAASTCFITAEATATASPLFTAVCPPELSSVRINTQHNAEQQQTIIIHYAKGLSILKTAPTSPVYYYVSVLLSSLLQSRNVIPPERSCFF